MYVRPNGPKENIFEKYFGICQKVVDITKALLERDKMGQIDSISLYLSYTFIYESRKFLYKVYKRYLTYAPWL